MSSCTFIGHRDCPQEIKDKLYATIEELIVCHNVNMFYVGTQGSFDRYVYSTLCLLEKKYDISVVVVLAYLNKFVGVYYDISKTVFPCELDSVPYRYAIIKRNEYMIRHAQYMVCYVNNNVSNSHKFVATAKKLGLHIINLGKQSI